MAEPLILSLETATLAGSIAVSRESTILAKEVGRPDVSHSNTLLGDINEILSKLDLSIRDIDLFAVANGPGSFTGLRIGLATVKALATTLDRSCIGIPTLEAIAHSAGVADAIVALLPAGRGEVFVQMFSTAHGAVTALDSPQHLSPDSAIDKYIDRAGILWAGEAAQLYSGLIQQRARTAGHRFVVADKLEVDVNEAWIITVPALTLAAHVASLALIRAQAGLQTTANSLKAIYVRPSDAEMKV
ncbi:MAG TPA: tRNA (adenosine(37)-N6)-threonylcarbamoyltransferase complex dimerization subunit type 1 TsaB [Pyrinomonadaceae bacterium]